MNHELKQFYGDIIIAGIECGGWVTSWASLSRYGFAGVEPDEIEVEIGELDEGMDDLIAPPIINIGTVAKGYDVLIDTMKSDWDGSRDIGLHSSYIGNCLAALVDKDAGEIDTELASYIIQLGLFGKVIYG